MVVESYSRRLCSPFNGVLQVVKKRRYIRFGRWNQDDGLTRFPLDQRIDAKEVDEHVQLYPQIIDSEKITALRVETSLRRAAK